MENQTYKAIGQTVKGDASVLKPMEFPMPKPTGRDLLVRVKAVSVNPVDYMSRSGESGKELDGPLVVGFDAAGIVEAMGVGVTRFRVGDEVWYAGDRTRQGSNAQFALVDERLVGRKPQSLSFEEAAALPLTAITAWESIFEHLGVVLPQSRVDPLGIRNPDENVNPKSILIINGAGGVGSIAIQIARHILKLMNVVATASRPESTEWCKSMGATHVINHHEPLRPQLEAIGVKIDYVLVAASPDPYIDQLTELINPLGKINMVLKLTKQFDTSYAFVKSVGLSFELMYTKSQFKIEMDSQGAILDALQKYVDDGIIRSTLTQKLDFNLENLRNAHILVEGGSTIGKIVLSIPEHNFEG